MFISHLSLSNILNILRTYFLCSICAILPIVNSCVFLTSQMIKTGNNCLRVSTWVYSLILLAVRWLGEMIAQIKSATKTKKYTEHIYLLNGALKQAKQCVCCELNHKTQLIWCRDWGTLKKNLSWFKVTEMSAWGLEELQLMWVI